MTATIILLFILMIVLIAGSVIIIHQTRRLSVAEDRVARSGQAMSRWISLLGAKLESSDPVRDLATRVVELCQEEFAASGVLFLGPLPLSAGDFHLPIWGAAGVCQGWGETVEEVQDGKTPLLRLDHDLPHHFFWSSDPLIYQGQRIRQWLPSVEADEFAAVLVAPVLQPDGRRGLLMLLRGGGEEPFVRMDQSTLGAVVKLTETRFRLLDLNQQIVELNHQVQHAHERGMRQIASGIIHNIGNAVTVVQMGLNDLKHNLIAPAQEMSGLLSHELVEELKAHAADGTLQEWAQPQADGGLAMPDLFAQTVGAIDAQLRDIAERTSEISLKFDDITAVIDLQQRFLGELGTEGVVSVGTILRDVQQACRGTLEQRSIQLEVRIESESRVLLDPAMLQHLLMRLMKQAVDSILIAQKSHAVIRLSSYNENRDGKDWVVIEVLDPGFDAPFDLDSMERGKVRGGMEERLDDYLFCRERVEKYGGSFAVSGRLDMGTAVRLQLPRYRD